MPRPLAWPRKGKPLPPRRAFPPPARPGGPGAAGGFFWVLSGPAGVRVSARLGVGALMDFRDSLILATPLAAGSTEAEWRSAVSRAYYAPFHVARRLLFGCGFQVPPADRAHGY